MAATKPPRWPADKPWAPYVSVHGRFLDVDSGDEVVLPDGPVPFLLAAQSGGYDLMWTWLEGNGERAYGVKPPGGRRQVDCGARERAARRQPMTFGVLPPLEDFRRYVRQFVDEGGGTALGETPRAFPMKLVGRDREAADLALEVRDPEIGSADLGPARGSETHVLRDVDDIWLFVRGLLAVAGDAADAGSDALAQAAESLASTIMDALGYEWI